MIRHAVDHGVNYLDLGCPHDMVRQESVARMVGCALQDGYRQRVRVSLAVPVSICESARDFERYLDTQMEWLQTGSVDMRTPRRRSAPRTPVMGDASYDHQWIPAALHRAGAGLFRRWLKVVFFCVITAGIYSLWAWRYLKRRTAEHTEIVA